MFTYQSRQARKTAFLAGFGALLAAASATSTFAQTAPASSLVASALTHADTADDAKATLTQINAAYQTLNSYSGKMTGTTQQAGHPAQTVTTDVVFAKPNKVDSVSMIGTKKTRAVSNGEQFFMVNSDGTYQKKAATKGADNIAEAIATSRATMSGIILLFLTHADGDKTIEKGATELTKLPDTTLDGVPVDVVSMMDGKTKITFSAGKDDHLLRRVFISAGTEGSVTEDYTEVKANAPLADTAFTFTPSANMKLVAAPVEPPMFDTRLKVGASPLPFAGTDTSGAKQTLAAYKGKVVLVDFWATWCGPCVGEMPNVIANYDKYHAKGFDIVGVSLDQPNSRQKLTAFTKTNKMPWPQIYEGKFWDSSLAKAYGIQSIPFSLLIGKDGKIAAVAPRGDELEPAIKAALAK